MKINWNTYDRKVNSQEFPFPCKIDTYIKGDGRDIPDSYEPKLDIMCGCSATTAENSGFAEQAQYIVFIPYPINSPKIFIGDRFTITTSNEVIVGYVERTLPVSLFNKLQVYVSREVWNIKPQD